MRKLRLFNGPDWDHSGGKLFVAAFNQKDAVELVNLAHDKAQGYNGNFTVGHMRKYWNQGLWGDSMEGVEHVLDGRVSREPLGTTGRGRVEHEDNQDRPCPRGC